MFAAGTNYISIPEGSSKRVSVFFVFWAVLSDEQMRKIWPFSLLNDEQMSNKVGVKHQPVLFKCVSWFHGWLMVETWVVFK